jgi:DNA polymerase I-like protein with 3'-5' exonuclease and polymerase domains
MSLQPATKEAYELLHAGALAFSRMSETGLRIDVPYLEKSIEEVQAQIRKMESALRKDPAFAMWNKHYGNSMKLNSRVQLGHVLFDLMGYKRNPFMGKSNDEAAFEHLRIPFKQNYFDVARMKKALNTYLYGIQKEVVSGICHPNFGVTGPESYRSQSDRPNFHNMPIRNKVISRVIRQCVIPRKGHVFIEADYGTQEVRGAYCYNKDQKLRHDILHGDMHTDRTKELYLLTTEQLGPVNADPGKTVRYVGKNRFVFAQFYGSFFKQCAPDLWDAISLYDLRRSDGVSLFEHLQSKGIKSLGPCDVEADYDPEPGTFEHHVQQVERKMWDQTYTTYAQWRKDWWALYQRQGGVNTLTGFRIYGVYRRNQILCNPIQGSSYHCQLWAMIEIQKEFLKRKMKSRIVDQIHDSLLIDTHRAEIWDVVEIVRHYMVEAVAEHWKWIIIPLSVEFEICEPSWADKATLKGAA